MLHGKHILITGVVDRASIGYAIARRCVEHGATVTLTAPPRDLERAREAAHHIGSELIELDVTRSDDWSALSLQLRRAGASLDGALHAVAYAPKDALDGPLHHTRPDGLTLAFHTSVASYAWLGGLLAELAPPEGASLVGLDFDASRAWPTYNWMGVCKAALEATNRYLARDLGPRRIRANLIAAGPLHTRAASAIPGFDLLLDTWEQTSPLSWDPSDAGPVADTAVHLLSERARATTGTIAYVDGGVHAMAGLPAARPTGSASSDVGVRSPALHPPVPT
jgi:enoyl-[acyl-carrier protein] reductase I